MIIFKNVSKKFAVHREHRPNSFQETLISLFQREKTPPEYVHILKDVSFELEQGQSVGLIGRNGAGKSTLLKLISKIIRPNRGTIEIKGRISSLLELGVGFHPDLTGQENIYLYGAVLGVSREEIRGKFDDIVAFAELESFINMPVRHYSSGMYLRLAFSTAIHVEPDILLVDEAFAVGDHFFQQRCLKRVADLMRSGVTVVLVSHAMDMIQQYCDRVIWLDEGTIQADGSTDEVIPLYIRDLYQGRSVAFSGKQEGLPTLLSPEEMQIASQMGGNVNRWGSGEIQITGVEFMDSSRTVQEVFTTGQTLVARIHYQTFKPVPNPVFGTALYRADGTHINGPNTQTADYPIPQTTETGYIEYIIENLNLLAGNYEFSAVVYDETTTHPYDHQHRLYTFVVETGKNKENQGTFYMPATWAHYPQKEQSGEPISTV